MVFPRKKSTIVHHLIPVSQRHFKGFYFLKFKEAAIKNCFVLFPVGHSGNAIIFLHFFFNLVWHIKRQNKRQSCKEDRNRATGYTPEIINNGHCTQGLKANYTWRSAARTGVICLSDETVSLWWAFGLIWFEKKWFKKTLFLICYLDS